MILLKLSSSGLISLSSPQHNPSVCFPGAKTLLLSSFAWPTDTTPFREAGSCCSTVHAGITKPSRQAGPGKAQTLRAVWEWPMGHPQGAQTLVSGRPLVFILAKGHPLSLCAKQLSSQPALLAQLIPLSQEANRPSKEGC